MLPLSVFHVIEDGYVFSSRSYTALACRKLGMCEIYAVSGVRLQAAEINLNQALASSQSTAA